MYGRWISVLSYKSKYLIRFCLIMACLILAVDVRAQNEGERSHPLYLLDLGHDDNSYAMLVNKSDQTLYLYHGSKDGPSVVKEYRCTTGRNNGTKQSEGDLRTPNGIYFFTSIREDKQLPARYGVRALVMDYPNVFDKVEQKTGYGIWLHAVEDDDRVKQSFDTEGCVVVTNGDIMELSKYIDLGSTPIIVDDSLKVVGSDRIETERDRVRKFVNDWVENWRNKDIDNYMSMYDERFFGYGRSKQQQARYKKAVFAAHRIKSIDISNIRIYKYNDYLVTVFYQDYQASNLRSRGMKRLYLTRNGDGFTILNERFQQM